MMYSEKRNMYGTLKSFDKAEHSKYDDLGKIAMIEFLHKRLPNLKTVENPNRFGIDLLTFNTLDKVAHAWEIEVRHGNWQGDISFPFNEINCIERKDYQWRKDEELFQKIPFGVSSNLKVYYVQLNKECNRAVIIEGDTILEFPLKPWANRKAEGEYVRQVPISLTIQVKLK